MAQQPMRGRAEGRWILRRAVTFSGLAVLAVLVVSVIELGVVLTHKEQGFVFTPRQAALWAALLLMLAALLLNGLVAAAQRAAAGPPAGGQPEAVGTPPPTAPGPVAARRTGLKALVIGTDGRASTSKLQAVLWTGAVLYALTMLLLLGKTVYAPTCAPTVTDCPDVSTYEDVFDDVVNQPLQPEYFALLGLPLAAAVAAKALTTGKIANGELVKPPATSSGVAAGVAEVVTDDRGTNDVLDFQYTAFNLLALVYFFVQFFSNLTDGLPDIPATLLALSGVSVTAYGTKKALETGVGPQVTATSPRRLLLTKDSELVATGTGFVSLGGKPTDLNAVFLDGRKLPTPADKWSPTRVSITLPTTKEALKELGLRPKPDSTDPGKLVVQDDAGQSSDPYEITIEGPADWDDS